MRAEWKGAGEQRERPQLLSTQGHLHKLELEVVLEGVGSDEAQFARCDGAGEEEEKQEKQGRCKKRREEMRKSITAKFKFGSFCRHNETNTQTQ